MGGIALEDRNRNVASACTGHGVGLGAVGQPLLAVPLAAYRTGAHPGGGSVPVAPGSGGGRRWRSRRRPPTACAGRCNGPHCFGSQTVVPPMELIQQPQERSRLSSGHLNQLGVAVHVVGGRYRVAVGGSREPNGCRRPAAALMKSGCCAAEAWVQGCRPVPRSCQSVMYGRFRARPYRCRLHRGAASAAAMRFRLGWGRIPGWCLAGWPEPGDRCQSASMPACRPKRFRLRAMVAGSGRSTEPASVGMGGGDTRTVIIHRHRGPSPRPHHDHASHFHGNAVLAAPAWARLERRTPPTGSLSISR